MNTLSEQSRVVGRIVFGKVGKREGPRVGDSLLRICCGDGLGGNLFSICKQSDGDALGTRAVLVAVVVPDLYAGNIGLLDIGVDDLHAFGLARNGLDNAIGQHRANLIAGLVDIDSLLDNTIRALYTLHARFIDRKIRKRSGPSALGGQRRRDAIYIAPRSTVVIGRLELDRNAVGSGTDPGLLNCDGRRLRLVGVGQRIADRARITCGICSRAIDARGVDVCGIARICSRFQLDSIAVSQNRAELDRIDRGRIDLANRVDDSLAVLSGSGKIAKACRPIVAIIERQLLAVNCPTPPFYANTIRLSRWIAGFPANCASRRLDSMFS